MNEYVVEFSPPLVGLFLVRSNLGLFNILATHEAIDTVSCHDSIEPGVWFWQVQLFRPDDYWPVIQAIHDCVCVENLLQRVELALE